jgi:hypothetical protein
MNTNIIVKFAIEGFHYWKEAPTEVRFLRPNHRHIFHFRLEKAVSHSDRDIEIILFGREVKQFLHKTFSSQNQPYLEFGSRSCEQIAEQLLKTFHLESAQVLEDNENGAIVYK